MNKSIKIKKFNVEIFIISIAYFIILQVAHRIIICVMRDFFQNANLFHFFFVNKRYKGEIIFVKYLIKY